MAECYCHGCGGVFGDDEKPVLDDYGEPIMNEGICPSCREALEVGRLVMKMPAKTRLTRTKTNWWFERQLANSEHISAKETALEALKKGVGE